MNKTVGCLHNSQVKTTSEGEISTCRRCGQQTLVTPDGKEKIIQRGEIDGVMTDIHPVVDPGREEAPLPLTVPPKPKKRNEIEAYCESNKDAMLADYRSMLLEDFYHKWHIGASTWTPLKQKWNVVGKRAESSKKATHHVVTVGVPLDVKDSLPPLPTFSDSWPEAVQLEWLRTYKDLRLAQKGEE